MNSEEGTSLAKMAVSIILVVLVIGAIIFLVFQAYNWFNSGTAKLTDKVNSIDSSAYSNFDDKDVSGTDALTTLKQFRDADFAIVITNDNATWNYCALYNADDKTATNGVYDCEIVDIANAASQDDCTQHLQWGDNGKTVRNTNFSPTVDKSTKAYINPRDVYHSKLIYDNVTRDVCGIYMYKVGGNEAGKTKAGKTDGTCS